MRFWRGFVGLICVAWLALAIGHWSRPLVQLDIGHSYMRPRLMNFHADEKNSEGLTYAFTQAESAVIVPGVGSGAAVLNLNFNGWRPDAVAPAQVQLRLGTSLIDMQPRRELANYRFFVPETSGDLNLGIVSNAYQPSATDPRELGIPLNGLGVQPLERFPPLTTAALLAGWIAFCWWFGLRLGLSGDAAALATAPLLGVWLVGWLFARMLTLDTLVPLLVAAILAHVLLWPLRWLLDRTTEYYDLPSTPRATQIVWAVFGLAMLWKVGGMLYPHIRVFDEAGHTKRVWWIFHGRFAELYFPNYTSFMGETVGLEGGYLPYSPLWYLVVAPFKVLGLPIGPTMNGLSAVFDVLKGLLLYVFGLATLRAQRPAALGMIIYHLFPMPYYLLSWGNYPTQFGLWASMGVLTVFALNYDRWIQSGSLATWVRQLLRQRRFWLWIGALFLSMATYTVTGILTWTMVLMLVVFELLRRSQRKRGLAVVLILGMIVAEVVLFAIYHVHFVSIIVQNTLPALFESAQTKVETPLEVANDPRASAWNNFKDNNSFIVTHTSTLLIILMVIGLIWLFVDRRSRRWWPLWSAWLGIFVVYGLLSAFVADMVLKHVFYIMPLVSLAVAWLAYSLWERFKPTQWAIIAGLIALATFTVDRWHFYLLIKRH